MKKNNTDRKSKLTPKQKKIIDIVATCVQVLVIIIAITVSAIVIANPISTSAKVSEGNVKLLPVLSDSMKGTDEYYETSGFDKKTSFETGDLIIAKKPKDIRKLKVGDIITFTGDVNGVEQLITHRIIKVVSDANGNAETYVTHGDANLPGATESVNPLKVLAVYSSHLNGIGKAILWLQNATNFLLVIVLPLALLFIYNIILVVRMIMEAKVAKAQEEAVTVPAVDEEEIKRKAIEEYLAKQNAENTSTAEDNLENDKASE